MSVLSISTKLGLLYAGSTAMLLLVVWTITSYWWYPPELEAYRRVEIGDSVSELRSTFGYSLLVSIERRSLPSVKDRRFKGEDWRKFTGTINVPYTEHDLQLWGGITCRDGKVIEAFGPVDRFKAFVRSPVPSFIDKLPRQTTVYEGKQPGGYLEPADNPPWLKGFSGDLILNDVRLIDRYYYEFTLRDGVVVAKRWFSDSF